MKWIKRIVVLTMVVLIIGLGWIGVRGYWLLDEALLQISVRDKIEEIRDQDDYVTIDRLPQTYLDAVVASEDHRFYTHRGIDWIALLRALWNNLKAGEIVEGGSTITQQLARNLYFTQEVTLERKSAESILAWILESRYEKDEILELYVNVIYFGEGYYGIGEACRGYYHKEVEELSTEECMMLAGIPNAPSVYAPTVNPRLAEERKAQVEDSMIRYGYIPSPE